jgi:hypothetical protein
MRKQIAREIVEASKEEHRFLTRESFDKVEPFDREAFDSGTNDEKRELIIGATWKVVHGYDMAI